MAAIRKEKSKTFGPVFEQKKNSYLYCAFVDESEECCLNTGAKGFALLLANCCTCYGNKKLGIK